MRERGMLLRVSRLRLQARTVARRNISTGSSRRVVAAGAAAAAAAACCASVARADSDADYEACFAPGTNGYPSLTYGKWEPNCKIRGTVPFPVICSR